MKTFCFTLVLLVCMTSLNAQDYHWVQQLGSIGFDFSKDIQIDEDGNVFSAGFYRGDHFTIADTVLPFVDNMDSYLAKFSPDGELLWTVPLYGKGVFDRSETLQLDGAGNIYMLSTVQETLYIGNQDSLHIPQSRNIDILLMKFTTDGDLLWHKTYGGPSSDLAYHMMLRGGGLVLAGHFNDTLYFGMDTLVSINKRQDMFIGAVDLDGNPLWAKQYGSTGLDRLYDIGEHANGDLSVCGYTNGNWMFGETQIVDSSAAFDFFLGRTDADGNPLWAVHGQSLADLQFGAETVTTDHDNNTYVGSYYNGPVTIGSIVLEDLGGSQFILARVNADGEIDWVINSAANGSDGVAGIYELEFQNNKLIAMGEIGAGMEAFNNEFDTSFQQDLLLTVLDSEGNVQAVMHDGGPGIIAAWGLDINTAGQLAFSSYGEGEIRLGNQEYTTRGYDIFIGSMDLSDILTTSVKNSILPSVKLYPNPTSSILYIESENKNIQTIRFLNRSGQLISEFSNVSEIPVHNLPSGLYFVHLVGEDFEVVRRFVKEE